MVSGTFVRKARSILILGAGFDCVNSDWGIDIGAGKFLHPHFGARLHGGDGDAIGGRCGCGRGEWAKCGLQDRACFCENRMITFSSMAFGFLGASSMLMFWSVRFSRASGRIIWASGDDASFFARFLIMSTSSSPYFTSTPNRRALSRTSRLGTLFSFKYL